MKTTVTFLVFLFIAIPLFSQGSTFSERLDNKYREDQFYAGVTYNLLGSKPQGISQSGFSSGFHLGFIRDMPINKRRNVSVGVGLGYSGNSYNQNLLISKDESGNILFNELKDDVEFTKNKFSTHLLELPIEFRWRSSTAGDYKFWRLYPGFKISYLLAHATKYRGFPEDYLLTDIDQFNNLQYGLTLSFGYNTVNFHFYYALNPVFNDDALLENEVIEMNVVKIGLMFYIL